MRPVIAVLACCVAVSARAADIPDFGCPAGMSVKHTGASLCLPGKTLKLDYQPKARTLAIAINGRAHRVERVARNYGPELIGMEKFIRFLPMELQPYLSRNVVLFDSVVRSSGGEGMGQCGSGAEKYLNAARINGTKVKVLGKVHVGSCFDSIEADGEAGNETDFSAYSVQGGKLAIRFLFYRGLMTPTGVLSSDFRQLEFPQAEE